jgi:hypothetical protein
MSLYRFDVKEHKGPHSSLVSIILKSWSQLDDGSIAITPEMTAQEVDINIRILKDELDMIATKAKTVAQ